MNAKPRLVRYVDLVALLLTLDGIGYVVAILLTPFQRNDLYTGAPVVYLAAALTVAAQLSGLLMTLMVLIRKHPYRVRVIASYISGLLLFALGLSIAHGWIAFRLG